MVIHEYYPKDFRVRREAETLVDNGYQVDVICLKKPTEKFGDIWNKVKIHRLPVKRHRGSPLIIYLLEYFSFFFLAFIKLTYLWIQKKFDVIHTHNPPDFLVFVAIILKLFKTKVIFDIHDRVPLLYVSRFGLNKRHPFIKFVELIEKSAIIFAHSVIVAVPVYKRMFNQQGISKKKISIILNTADEKYFFPYKSNGVKNNEKLKLFHHGTLVKRYGVDILIEAANLLRKKGIDFSLEIYGEGDFRSYLEKLISKLELEKYTFLKGFLLLDYLPEKIAKADLCIVPNRKDDFMDTVLPTKLLEYIAMGKPVIVSRTKGVTDIFSEEEVTFFEPGDAEELAEEIVFFKKNPGLFMKKVSKAKERNKEISWGNQKNILLKVYENLDV